MPAQPYSTGEVDIVLECTGAYLNRKVLQPYFDIGVKKVRTGQYNSQLYTELEPGLLMHACMHACPLTAGWDVWALSPTSHVADAPLPPCRCSSFLADDRWWSLRPSRTP